MKNKPDKKQLNKRNIIIKAKRLLRKFVSFVLNPHLLICFGIAWMITNGWCYLFMAFGGLLKINWMTIVGTAYATFLWLPFTPEKILTVIISIFLLRLIFPDDKRTLAILENEFKKVKATLKVKKKEHKEKREAKKQLKSDPEHESEQEMSHSSMSDNESDDIIDRSDDRDAG